MLQANVGDIISWTIGAGGSGGASGTVNSGTDGNPGTASIVKKNGTIILNAAGGFGGYGSYHSSGSTNTNTDGTGGIGGGIKSPYPHALKGLTGGYNTVSSTGSGVGGAPAQYPVGTAALIGNGGNGGNQAGGQTAGLTGNTGAIEISYN